MQPIRGTKIQKYLYTSLKMTTRNDSLSGTLHHLDKSLCDPGCGLSQMLKHKPTISNKSKAFGIFQISRSIFQVFQCEMKKYQRYLNFSKISRLQKLSLVMVKNKIWINNLAGFGISILYVHFGQFQYFYGLENGFHNSIRFQYRMGTL